MFAEFQEIIPLNLVFECTVSTEKDVWDEINVGTVGKLTIGSRSEREGFVVCVHDPGKVEMILCLIARDFATYHT
jgi:hypothetical protein